MQQAEAAYGIKAPLANIFSSQLVPCAAYEANHPLFFTWTQDPLMLVSSKVPALFEHRSQVTRPTGLNTSRSKRGFKHFTLAEVEAAWRFYYFTVWAQMPVRLQRWEFCS